MYICQSRVLLQNVAQWYTVEWGQLQKWFNGSPVCDCDEERETVSTSCWDVRITRKSWISCRMLLTIFGLLRSVKVTCNSRTIFFLHLHEQIASQNKWTEILKLHFFNSSNQIPVIERFLDLILSYLHHSDDIYTCEDSHHCCYNSSFWFYNMCLYFGGSSQHVASLYTVMLLLELISGATRLSTDINNNTWCNVM